MTAVEVVLDPQRSRRLEALVRGRHLTVTDIIREAVEAERNAARREHVVERLKELQERNVQVPTADEILRLLEGERTPQRPE